MYFQKTMFVANPGPHQVPLHPKHSTASPVPVTHAAGGGEAKRVTSGGHQRIFNTAPATGSKVHRGGNPVRKPKIHAPHPRSRLGKGPG